MFNDYKLSDISEIETPEFLIFESKVESNIDTIISMIGDKKRLVPHAKTHKSKYILHKLIKKLDPKKRFRVEYENKKSHDCTKLVFNGTYKII